MTTFANVRGHQYDLPALAAAFPLLIDAVLPLLPDAGAPEPGQIQAAIDQLLDGNPASVEFRGRRRYVLHTFDDIPSGLFCDECDQVCEATSRGIRPVETIDNSWRFVLRAVSRSPLPIVAITNRIASANLDLEMLSGTNSAITWTAGERYQRGVGAISVPVGSPRVGFLRQVFAHAVLSNDDEWPLLAP